MSEKLTIYIDRLRDGTVEQIQETLPPSFMEIEEAALNFRSPISILGEAYVTPTHLILKLELKTKASLPCSICNTWIEVPLEIKDVYHTEPLEQIPSAIFNYRELIKELLLLEVPSFAECDKGNCSERAFVNNYLKKQKKTSAKQQFPFADLS